MVARGRGFTLLEMLVVLVITGMVTSLLMGGLLQVMRLQAHFESEAFNTQLGAMHRDWFRQTVNGLIPDHPHGLHLFRGEARQLQGLTLSPLDLPEGTMAPFAWSLAFDRSRDETSLRYGLSDAPATIISWTGNSGSFEYIDTEGNSHDTWPPFLGQWPQLPSAIRLKTGERGEAEMLIAVPKGPLAPRMRLRDVEA